SARRAPSKEHCPSVTRTTLGTVSLLGACVTIRFRIAPSEYGRCGLYRGTYFLGCPRKVLRTSLDHEFVDFRSRRKALLLQAAFRVVSEQKAFSDRSISLPDIDAAAALISEGWGKGHVRHPQPHRLSRCDRAGEPHAVQRQRGFLADPDQQHLL